MPEWLGLEGLNGYMYAVLYLLFIGNLESQLPSIISSNIRYLPYLLQ